MQNDVHYRNLEAMHAKAACNLAYCKGLRMTVSEGRAEITLPVAPSFFHAAGAVHGFLYFKLLDEAGFFAANSLVTDVFVLTSSFHLDLLRPVTTGILKAQGAVVHNGKSGIIADSVLYDEAGAQIARGTGTFVRSRIPLDGDIGYGG